MLDDLTKLYEKARYSDENISDSELEEAKKINEKL